MNGNTGKVLAAVLSIVMLFFGMVIGAQRNEIANQGKFVPKEQYQLDIKDLKGMLAEIRGDIKRYHMEAGRTGR